MGKNQRKDRREGKHETGSWMKKRGPKGKAPGKAMSPGKLQKLRALEEAHWKRKIPKLIASLALERGESMDAGEARMALYTTLQVIDEAPDLKFDGSGDKVQGLHACFERAAELTGSSPLTLKRLFWSHFKTDGDTYEIADTSKRGNGSDSVDKATLYKVKPEQSAAISAFIKFSAGPRRTARSSSPSSSCGALASSGRAPFTSRAAT